MTRKRPQSQPQEPPAQDNGELQPRRRFNDGWHVAKDIPIALIFAVIAQTGGFIWWMAGLSGKLDNAIATMVEFKSERYTREDARRDRELLDTKFQAGKISDGDIERRITSMELRMDRLERK